MFFFFFNKDNKQDINKLGVHYKERIYREFLGIEPPEGYDKEALK